MAFNAYARLTLNGVALTGDVSVAHIGAVNVESEYVEVSRLSFGVAAARAVGSGLATGRRQYEPLRFVKPIDRTTPLLYRGLAQNERVSGEVLLFDTDPADGILRHFFTVGVENAAIAAIGSVNPDVRDPVFSTWVAYEEVTLTFGRITLTHVPTGTQVEDQIGRNP